MVKLCACLQAYKKRIKMKQTEIEMIPEKCIFCRKECSAGIWRSPQYKSEKVLLSCSADCRDKYLLMKMERIKVNYPKFYDKLIKSKKQGAFWIK